MTEPRPLEPDEAALLLWMLRGDFPGVEALREQVPLTSVLGAWSPGSASLDLAVARTARRAAAPAGPVPGQVWSYGPDGECLGTVLLWVVDGYLSAIEYGWVTDVAPTTLPHVDTLRDHGVDPGPVRFFPYERNQGV